MSIDYKDVSQFRVQRIGTNINCWYRDSQGAPGVRNLEFSQNHKERSTLRVL